MTYRGTFETVAAGVLGVALIGDAPAGARTLTMCTPAIVPDASGYLNCTVRATSRSPIGIVARIMSGAGVDVTEFGTGFRASPDLTGHGYYAEETAGSLADDARYCKATIDGVRAKGGVDISLTAFDQHGAAVATVNGASPSSKRPCM
jgi:hypothetical protein